MNLDQLEYFLGVVDRKHFSHAAEEASISQSSLSKHIAKLEKELGVRLFERNSRNVKVTEAGKVFARHAKTIVKNYREMQRDMRPFQELLPSGAIRLGSSAHIGKAMLVGPVASFLKAHPGMTVAVKEGSTAYVMGLLLSGELDVAFIAHLISPLEDSSNTDGFDLRRYRRHTVVEDEYFIIASKDSAIARKIRGKADWADLESERLILLDKGYSLNGMVRDCCRISGFEANVVFESNQVDAILGMVAANSGITLMSSKVTTAFGAKGLALIRMDRPIKRNSVIVYPEQPAPPDYAEVFIRYLMRFHAEFAPASRD